jgi:SAM-dependent methyltransferase
MNMKSLANMSLYANGRSYDLMLGSAKPDAEITFCQALAAGAHQRLLELACGTGRLAIPLAQAGFDVTGIDAAGSMLAVARAKASACGVDLSLVSADMRRFDLGTEFGLILIADNSLAHLHDADDLRAALTCVRRHLDDGGLFVVDQFNPSMALLMRDPTVRYPVAVFTDPQGSEVRVTESVHYDASAQLSHTTWFFERDDGTQERHELALRVYFPAELDALMQFCGFRIVRKCGSWAGEPFSSQSRHQVLVCDAA